MTIAKNTGRILYKWMNDMASNSMMIVDDTSVYTGK
jgi:hypothetical protein